MLILTLLNLFKHLSLQFSLLSSGGKQAKPYFHAMRWRRRQFACRPKASVSSSQFWSCCCSFLWHILTCFSCFLFNLFKVPIFRLPSVISFHHDIYHVSFGPKATTVKDLAPISLTLWFPSRLYNNCKNNWDLLKIGLKIRFNLKKFCSKCYKILNIFGLVWKLSWIIKISFINYWVKDSLTENEIRLILKVSFQLLPKSTGD